MQRPILRRRVHFELNATAHPPATNQRRFSVCDANNGLTVEVLK